MLVLGPREERRQLQAHGLPFCDSARRCAALTESEAAKQVRARWSPRVMRKPPCMAIPCTTCTTHAASTHVRSVCRRHGLLQPLSSRASFWLVASRPVVTSRRSKASVTPCAQLSLPCHAPSRNLQSKRERKLEAAGSTGAEPGTCPSAWRRADTGRAEGLLLEQHRQRARAQRVFALHLEEIAVLRAVRACGCRAGNFPAGVRLCMQLISARCSRSASVRVALGDRACLTAWLCCQQGSSVSTPVHLLCHGGHAADAVCRARRAAPRARHESLAGAALARQNSLA